ncbi:hypothetical protein SAPIO_CDS2077 [Scedosporium apiospermum]|uniref:Uncharacterized protein n=1 Tax=Pseudallescheria apiosperma TaxID=563466 RepID=A0A084GD70_PSEDA|nr:uncharacterized protein SAPIO_CDS2077 [Scedosporium apiospermum]KEZ45282.1 hypothetical protein SAPIO_CDS2077 [Scedosporium apiospermum]
MDELGSVMKAIELSAPNRDGIPGTEEKTTDLPPPAQKTDDTRLEEERQDDTSSNVEEQKVSRPTAPDLWEQINRFRETIYACEKSVKADYDLFYNTDPSGLTRPVLEQARERLRRNKETLAKMMNEVKSTMKDIQEGRRNVGRQAAAAEAVNNTSD